jgi:hypothetical protein
MRDHAADIRALRKQSNAAIAALDPDYVVGFMAHDVRVEVAGGGTLVGRLANREAFAEQMESGADRPAAGNRARHLDRPLAGEGADAAAAGDVHGRVAIRRDGVGDRGGTVRRVAHPRVPNRRSRCRFDLSLDKALFRRPFTRGVTSHTLKASDVSAPVPCPRGQG